MNRGFFQIGIFRGKIETNMGTLFRSAHVFEANAIFTIERRYKQMKSDISKAWRHVPLSHYESFDSFKATLPKGSELIGVELTEDASGIVNFVHPERAVYLLGAEDEGLPEHILRHCKYRLRLPGKFSMNVSTAGSIVMYDRFAKQTIK